MPDINLIWAAAADATVATSYKIQSDLAASGTFVTITTQSASNRGDGSYDPHETTLNGLVSVEDTAITLTDATNFAEGDYIVIQSDYAREMVLLGSKSGATFSNCTRGIGATVPQEHESGAVVYQAHESYLDSAVNFGSRHVIRYRVIRVQGSDESVAAELPAINPTLPPTNNLTTVWGILQDIQGNPKSGITISLAISEADNFHTDSGEFLYKEAETTTTDTDGYFELFIPRNAAHGGGGVFTLSIDAGGAGASSWSITSIPDQDHVNFLDT